MKSDNIRTGISYFGNRNPQHFLTDVENIRKHNCNFIVHTFSENDMSFYKETLSEIVRISKEGGLEVYIDPWGVGRVFGGEATSDFALNYRDACQLFSTGEPAPACCINNPRFRDFMTTWINEVREIGADVAFWDEPHFFIEWGKEEAEQRWTCWCRFCREKYQKSFGAPMPAGLNRDMIKFREDSVVDFLSFLTDYAHDKNLRNALCLLPNRDHRFGISDWSRAAALPHLDIIGTDPYWLWFGKDIDNFFGQRCTELVSLAKKHEKEAQVWIQNFNVPAGREKEISKAVELAYRKGIRNFAAWSYLGTAYMSYIKSDNPEMVWETLGENYGRMLNGNILRT